MATAREEGSSAPQYREDSRGEERPGEGSKIPRPGGMSTAEKNRLHAADFAFPRERREPLVDARHVRNAIARFDQVEDVTDRERDQAWVRIRRAAKRFGVEAEADDGRALFAGGRARKR
jgi:hypothetical protein